MANGAGPNVRKRDRATARPDRRVKRSREALGRALVELMLARRFRDITVRHVLERARVGRATFYSHFRNKHDLLLSETERFCLLLEQHFTATERGRRLAPVAELFAHVAEFHLFQRAVERSELRDQVFELVQGHMARLIERRLAMRVPPPEGLPPALAGRALAASLLEMLRWWLDRDTRPSAREMDERFHALAGGGVDGAGGRR